MGYTNNLFGDNNLLGTFIWKKALEKKGIIHLGEEELKEHHKRIREENPLELQKIKRLRPEREMEKATGEQEQELLQRQKEAEHLKSWEEHSFQLQQAKLRSTIRIRDGRAKPIDLLVNYISAEDDFGWPGGGHARTVRFPQQPHGGRHGGPAGGHPCLQGSGAG